MKVILLKRVKTIGDIGDIKEVSDGYAINFLIPQKLVEPATVENMSKLKSIKNQSLKKADEDLILTQKIANQLSGLVIEISSKSSSDGKLYSAISVGMIAEKLKEKGIMIDKKQINLMKPIKELGEHSVFIILNHGLEPEITVIVNE